MTNNRTAPRSIAFQINTFADLRQKGSDVADWIEEARSVIFDPVHRLLDASVGVQSRHRHDEEGISGDHWISIAMDPFLGDTTAKYRFTDRAWGIILEKVREGRVRHLELRAVRFEPTQMSDDVAIGFRFSTGDSGEAAHAIGAFVRMELYEDAFLPSGQRFIDFAKRTAAWFSAAYGFITVNYEDWEGSPYEQEIGQSTEEGLRASREWVRGYFWGNFLSGKHIIRLGGIERVRKEAPCFLVEGVSEVPGQLVFLQLTPDVTTIPDGALKTLAMWLSPVLPQSRTSRKPYRDHREQLKDDGLVPVPPKNVGPIPIESASEIADLTIPFTVYVDKPLSKRAEKAFKDLVSDWVGVGWYAGYGGKGGFRYASEPAFLDDDGEPTIEWWIDKGYADLDAALEVLMRCLRKFARFGWTDVEGNPVVIKKVVLGWRIVE